MMTAVHQNAKGDWVLPQLYYRDGKRTTRKKLLDQIERNALLQELMQLDPRIRDLIEEASKERCVPGYNTLHRFYRYYKPRIVELVGWERGIEKKPWTDEDLEREWNERRKDRTPCDRRLLTMEAYDAVYKPVYALLPADETDMFPEGIMQNGMFCPTLQLKYGREYP